MINVPLTYLSLYLVLTVVFLLSSGNQKIKTTGWLFSVIALVLIIGLRGVDIGDDTKEYISSFEQNRFRETVSYELTWKYICIFVKDILGGGIQWVLIIYSTITVIPITIVCRKKSPYPYLSLLLFIILGYAFHSMNIMRQAVAISYSLLLLYEIEEKHYMGAAISFAIAVLFHSSALVIVPLLLCAYGFKKIPLNIQLILLFVSLLIGSLFYAKINSLAGLLTYEKYQNYQYYSDNRGANISNLLIMNTVKTLIAILLLSRAKTKSLFITILCTNFLQEVSLKLFTVKS